MTLATLELETAFTLLVVACLAAVQARAVRGAQRHRLLEQCRQRGRPERYDEIVAASETIAFLAASGVVIAAVVATLLASRSLGARPTRKALRLPGARPSSPFPRSPPFAPRSHITGSAADPRRCQ